MPESIAAYLPGLARWFLNRKPKLKAGTEIKHQYCTAIPIGTSVAQSWDPDYAALCGDVVGAEMERFGIHLWLAPALNIHRTIRCGRNYEYYSEDPLLSGRIAAGITKGVQRHSGCGVTIKHYAANNQETNRYNSNSLVSERALREIYLKGFGIAVREGDPAAVMSSYNLVNGVHTSQHRGLIEDILRCEFGFDGIVMTDWVTGGSVLSKNAKHPVPHAGEVAAAGGDLFMPGSKKEIREITDALRDGRLTERQLRINASRVIHAVRRLCEGGNIHAL
jgi:beta-glucosidase